MNKSDMNKPENIKDLEGFAAEKANDVEPAVRKAVGAALAFAIASIAAAVGLEINDVSAPWVQVAIAFLAPIGTGFLIRKGVFSPNSVKFLMDYYRSGRVPGNGNDK